MKSDPRPDQQITFTRCRHEARPIKYGDLPSAAHNQTGMFHLPGGIGDGWPLDTQHFGEQVLSDLQTVIVSAVTHHEQPTRQPLSICGALLIVGTIPTHQRSGWKPPAAPASGPHTPRRLRSRCDHVLVLIVPSRTR